MSLESGDNFVRNDLTQVQRILIERFWPKAKTKEEKNILVVLGIGAKFYQIEQEVIDFIKQNPNATILELGQFLPEEEELTIVDDDELED